MSMTPSDLTSLTRERDAAIEENLPRIIADADNYLGTDYADVVRRCRMLMAATSLAGMTRATRDQVEALRAEALDTCARGLAALGADRIGAARNVHEIGEASVSEQRERLTRLEAQIHRLRTRAGQRAYIEQHDLVAAVWGGARVDGQVRIADALERGALDEARQLLAGRFTLLGAPRRAMAAASADLTCAARLAAANAVFEHRSEEWVLDADQVDQAMLDTQRAPRLAGDEWEAYQVATDAATLHQERTSPGRVRGTLRRMWRAQDHAARYLDIQIKAASAREVMEFCALAPGSAPELVVTEPYWRRTRFALALAGAVRVETPAGPRTWVVWTPLGETTAKTSAGRRRYAERILAAEQYPRDLDGTEVVHCAGREGTLPTQWPHTGPMVPATTIADAPTCMHLQAQWRLNGGARDAAVLDCPDCGYERAAVIPLHRLPAGHELLRRLSTSSYLRRERFYRILTGHKDPGAEVSVEQLREVDGLAPLRNAAYGRGLRPKPVPTRTGLRSVLAGSR